MIYLIEITIGEVVFRAEKKKESNKQCEAAKVRTLHPKITSKKTARRFRKRTFLT